MRSLFLGLLLLTLQLAVASGCASTDAQAAQESRTGPVNVTLSSKADTTRVTLGDARYRIELREITDSRCPANAKCIWQGELAAEFTVERERAGEQESRRFTLGQETMPALTMLGASFDLLTITETTVEIRVALESAGR